MFKPYTFSPKVMIIYTIVQVRCMYILPVDDEAVAMVTRKSGEYTITHMCFTILPSDALFSVNCYYE